MRDRALFSRLRTALLATAALGALLFGGLAVPAESAAAADLGLFDPGHIISDEIFFDSSTMTEAQIQAFFTQRLGSCESGKKCLLNFTQNTTSETADSRCAVYKGAKNETAARIVKKVSKACGINPRVLIVMLQKEQGLVTSRAPGSWAWQAAMGYGCPDTAACDTRYYGFFNQVYMAAWQMKNYTVNPSYFRYRAGATAAIQWHPNTSCGTSQVRIRNKATAALYNYTPYRPNQAALNAGYGSGNSCSSYGNRNFFNYYTDWFGTTQYSTSGAIGVKYRATGGISGPLGAPIRNETVVPGGYEQIFKNGYIMHSSAGTWAVKGNIRIEYKRQNRAAGALKFPTADEQAIPGGHRQRFTGGTIYSSSKGYYTVAGSWAQAYARVKEQAGPLGFPVGNYRSTTGGQVQSFQNGHIYRSSNGAYSVKGSIGAAFAQQKSTKGWLGFPLEDEHAVRGGYTQRYEGGSLYASGAGVFGVRPRIAAGYAKAGGVDGRLGLPISAQKWTGTMYVQAFQGGKIYLKSTGPVIRYN